MQIGHLNVRGFVVTLQEMPEKERFIQAHFKERGIEAEAFNGFSAAVSGLKTIHSYELDDPGSGWNIGTKPVATWLSFYALWMTMNVLPDPYFLQLEWDAQFAPDWRERAERAVRDVPPDFDLLLLGSCCTGGVPKKLVKGEVWDVRYPACGHATIIAKKALPIMLSTQRKVYAPIDISLMLHTFHKLKVFCVLPRMVDQFDTDLAP